MAVRRHGSLAGPECPWCSEQMSRTGRNGDTDYYECVNLHYLSIDNDPEPDDEEDW